MQTNRLRNWYIGIAVFVVILAVAGVVAYQFAPAVRFAFRADSGTLEQINLPEGFEISIFAEEIDGARTMRLGDNGTLFVGTRNTNTIYAIPNAASSERAESIIELDTGLDYPNGLALVDGDLYVAEVSEIWRYDDIESNLNNPQRTLITNDLPSSRQHGWRYLGYGPDEKLYVAIGAPCNVCELEERFGTISRLNLDGSEFETHVQGVRNSVGFDWHPQTGDLWFTNNGRDLMGDDIPPDTLHHVTREDMHFGFPFCHAGTIPDPEFGEQRDCGEFDTPSRDLTPHGASLGMRFYTGEMFPEAYHNQIFVAEHGSWNRTVPIGYRIMLAELNERNEVVSYEPFADGWLNDETGTAWGRPVDVLVMPDGALLVSDNAANMIYRISYTGES